MRKKNIGNGNIVVCLNFTKGLCEKDCPDQKPHVSDSCCYLAKGLHPRCYCQPVFVALMREAIKGGTDNGLYD